MYSACQGGHLNIISYIIDYIKNSDFNRSLIYDIGDHFDSRVTKNSDYWSNGLIGACSGGHLSIAQLMVKLGVDSLAINQGLYNACKYGKLMLAQYMVSCGANEFDKALATAAGENYLECVKYMIECGATNLSMAIINAKYNNHTEIVEYLST